MNGETANPGPHDDVPLTLSVLPAHTAYDYEHMADRLLDPELLAGAVAIRVFRAPLLAVPVGGRRRGGMLSITSQAIGAAIAAVLNSLPGFPDVRLISIPAPPGGYAVAWGEPPPTALPGDARTHFYGLRQPRVPRPSAAPAARFDLLRSAS
jgi:hypothetical protein